MHRHFGVSPAFHSCPNKEKARRETIINIYQELFYNSVPETEQYISMCGLNAHNGVLQKKSELGQMLSVGLIQPHQFHGVDINPEIIQKNSEANKDAKWNCTDIYKYIDSLYAKCDLNPAIVNADFISLKEYGCKKTTDMLYVLEATKKQNILFICNVMVNNPHEDGHNQEVAYLSDSDFIIEEFKKNKRFMYLWSTSNWQEYGQKYVYKGTGRKSRTVMCTVIFYKKGIGH